MAGRPTRIFNPELHEKLERAMGETGISLSALAETLGHSPSTFTRSHRLKSYSRAVTAELDGLLAAGWPSLPLEAAKNPPEPVEQSLQNHLQILYKFAQILPEVTAALEGVLDQRRQAH